MSVPSRSKSIRTTRTAAYCFKEAEFLFRKPELETECYKSPNSYQKIHVTQNSKTNHVQQGFQYVTLFTFLTRYHRCFWDGSIWWSRPISEQIWWPVQPVEPSPKLRPKWLASSERSTRLCTWPWRGLYRKYDVSCHWLSCKGQSTFSRFFVLKRFGSVFVFLRVENNHSYCYSSSTRKKTNLRDFPLCFVLKVCCSLVFQHQAPLVWDSKPLKCLTFYRWSEAIR